MWALLFWPTWSAAADWTLLIDERSLNASLHLGTKRVKRRRETDVTFLLFFVHISLLYVVYSSTIGMQSMRDAVTVAVETISTFLMTGLHSITATSHLRSQSKKVSLKNETQLSEKKQK